MEYPTIQIENKKYNISFDYGTIRQLADDWNLTKPTQVAKRINDVMNKAVPKKGKTASELTFKDIDVLQDTFYAAITSVNNEVHFTAVELMKIVLVDKDVLIDITKHYIDSLPKAKPDVDPNVRRVQKKK